LAVALARVHSAFSTKVLVPHWLAPEPFGGLGDLQTAGGVGVGHQDGCRVSTAGVRMNPIAVASLVTSDMLGLIRVKWVVAALMVSVSSTEQTAPLGSSVYCLDCPSSG